MTAKSPSIEDVVCLHADQTEDKTFTLNINNTVKVYLSNFNVNFPATVVLSNADPYTWMPGTVSGAPLTSLGGARSYVTIVSQPTRPGNVAANNIALHVHVANKKGQADTDPTDEPTVNYVI
jgi:hypothetical protein